VSAAHLQQRPRAGWLNAARRGLSGLALVTAVGAVLAFVMLGLLPLTGWYRPATVLSGSMAPHIPTGAVVIDRPVPLRSVKVGDVITYHIPIGDHHLVTHRVVSVLVAGDHPVVTTKGDGNNTVDPWQARLLDGPAWKVAVVVPHLGYVLAWFRQPMARALMLGVVAVVLAALWVRRIWAGPDRRTWPSTYPDGAPRLA
jgi:signal peptidase